MISEPSPWWCPPLLSVLRRQRQAGLSVSSTLTWSTSKLQARQSYTVRLIDQKKEPSLIFTKIVD